MKQKKRTKKVLFLINLMRNKMSAKIDLRGKRFGKLTVIDLAVDIPYKKKKWLCVCDCGEKVIVSGSNLKKGTHQCKKCAIEESRKLKIKHGYTKTKLYYVWYTMKNRCERETSKSYNDYGAKGVYLCEEWHDAKKFIDWAIANGYKEGLEIDRIDVTDGYKPSNCRWVKRIDNANNKRNNKYIEHDGQVKTLAEWSRYYNVNYKNLSRNINKGYSLEEAVIRERTGDRTHKKTREKQQKYETVL